MQHHAWVALTYHEAYTVTWKVVLWNNNEWSHFCEPILLLRDSNPLRRRCEHAVGRQKWFIGFCYWTYAIFTCTPAGCPFKLVLMFLKTSKKSLYFFTHFIFFLYIKSPYPSTHVELIWLAHQRHHIKKGKPSLNKLCHRFALDNCGPRWPKSLNSCELKGSIEKCTAVKDILYQYHAQIDPKKKWQASHLPPCCVEPSHKQSLCLSFSDRESESV